MSQIKLSILKQKNLVKTAVARWEKLNPNPQCELFYNTPFQLLVSVVLSAQTTDKMVNRSMESVYRQGFTPKKVLLLKESGIYQIIKSTIICNDNLYTK